MEIGFALTCCTTLHRRGISCTPARCFRWKPSISPSLHRARRVATPPGRAAAARACLEKSSRQAHWVWTSGQRAISAPCSLKFRMHPTLASQQAHFGSCSMCLFVSMCKHALLVSLSLPLLKNAGRTGQPAAAQRARHTVYGQQRWVLFVCCLNLSWKCVCCMASMASDAVHGQQRWVLFGKGVQRSCCLLHAVSLAVGCMT